LIPVKKEKKKDVNKMQSTGKHFFMSQLFVLERKRHVGTGIKMFVY